MKQLSRKSFAAAVIALSVVMFIAVNVAAGVLLRSARIDLTDNSLYTLSEGTYATLENLEEPITLRFFYSRDATAAYPSVNSYARRVRDLLHEYEALADGNIIVEEINPETFTPEEDEAVAAGLTGAPTQTGETVYFGLAGSNTLDDTEVIAFFDADREPYVEYDVTSLIHRLSTREQPKLGIVSVIPLAEGVGGLMAAYQGNAQPLAVYRQLDQAFDMTPLQRDMDRIPEDITTLLVVHPAGLPQNTLYAIDQFVLRGGHALVFVDPLSELAKQASGGGQFGAAPDAAPTSSTLEPLFGAWGVDFQPMQVVADGALAQRVQFGTAGQPEIMSHIVWLRLTEESFNQDDIVVGNLNQINLATAGTISHTEGATTNFMPLFSSSPNTAFFGAAEVNATEDPRELLTQFVPSGEVHTIAARISGPAMSAYPDGPPPAEEAADADAADAAPEAPLPAHIGQADNINVMVVADTDIFDDRFWVQVQNILGQQVLIPTAENGAFILSAVENMMGSNEMISLRTRAVSDRPFTVVEDLQRQAEAQFLTEEQMLEQRVEQTEARLAELQGTGGGGAEAQEIFSPEQQAEIDNFRQQLIETRASLREVQANLRRNVELLGQTITFINIALMPLLIAILASALAVFRRRRRMKARGI